MPLEFDNAADYEPIQRDDMLRFDDLREGQSVSFEKGQGPKGPRAENVKAF